MDWKGWLSKATWTSSTPADTCPSISRVDAIEDPVAEHPGSLALRLYDAPGRKLNEVATFTWKKGTTLSFLENALLRHSRSLAHSCNGVKLGPLSTTGISDFRVVSTDDLVSTVDVNQILQGRVKHVAVVVTQHGSQEPSTVSPPPTSIRSSDDTPLTQGLSHPNAGLQLSLLATQSVSTSSQITPRDTRVTRKTNLNAAGYNQLRFMELAKYNRGATAAPRPVAWKEVEQHRFPHDCWVVLHNNVYDVTYYLDYHPGGRKILAAYAGKDITTQFNKYHPWVNSSAILKHQHIGWIQARDPPPLRVPHSQLSTEQRALTNSPNPLPFPAPCSSVLLSIPEHNSLPDRIDEDDSSR